MGLMIKVYGKIYLITCLANDKIYVGQTVGSLKLRLRNHVSHALAYLSGKYKGQDTSLFRAIRKYGKENFSIKTLCSCQSKEELDLMEDLYIASYRSMDKSVGYNLKRGGANGKHSKEVREFCGSFHRGRKPSEASRKKMSISIRKSLLLSPRIISEATKEKHRTRPRGPRPQETKDLLRSMFSGKNGPGFKHEVKTEDIVKLYEQGFSCPQIATLFPLSEGGVLHRLKKAGVQRRNSGQAAHQRKSSEQLPVKY
jgi:group I intron endonuclease